MTDLPGQWLLAGLALMVLVLLFSSLRYRIAATAARRQNRQLERALAARGPADDAADDVADDAAARRRLETQHAEVEAKNRELQNLLYSVSHDLKSPLVTIRGFLGLITDDVKEGNVERLERDVARVDEAVEKMAELLDELLERSRVAGGQERSAATDSRSTPPPPAAASPRSTP